MARSAQDTSHRPRRPLRVALPAALVAVASLLVACGEEPTNETAARPAAGQGTAAMVATAAASEPSLRYGRAEAPARSPGAIRLATYNVLNLFDDVDDPALGGRFDDLFDRRVDQREKPEAQRIAVAKALRELDADIVGLQEIEGEHALELLRTSYLDGMGYDHVATIDVGQERGIQQAVLSRYPIREVRVWPNLPLRGEHPALYGDEPNRYAGEPLTYRRSPLFVHVEIPVPESDGWPYDLGVFVIHHKSGRHNDYWRDAEAVALVDLVERIVRHGPTMDVAIIGDFNAVDGDLCLDVYREAGFRSVRGDRSPTHESGRAIDDILVNDLLLDQIDDGSDFVLGTTLRPEGADWRTTDPPSGFASDHLPVAVDLVPVMR